MRNFSVVVDQMLSEIPDDQITLRSRLKSLKESSMYAAPEAQSEWWNACAELLNLFCATTNTEWKSKLYEIFKGEK